MFRKLYYMFLPAFFCIALQVGAQQFLILQKGSNQKFRIKYEVGDEIVYQQKGREYFVRDKITELYKDFLVLNENILRPEEIEVVDVRNKDERNQTVGNLSTLMLGGGVLLLLTESINGLYHDGKISYSHSSLIISGSLIAGGFILSKFKYKFFK